MAAIKSKKGQGLGFIAVVILIALLYFIFRYNTETYDFVMTAGDQQAHLVTSYVETEKAKFYSETVLEQAAYETAWKFGAITNCSDFSAKICGKQTEFLNNATNIFYNYISRYEPSSIDLDTSFPDYDFRINKCSNTGIEIEAFGFGETCFLRPDYPFPKVPCIDQANKTDCEAVNLTTGGQACNWTITVEPNYCDNLITEPACDALLNKTVCEANSDCRWETSYSENINILALTSSNYQFSIDSDAHFIKNIDCTGYNAFVATRKNVQAFKPSCTLNVTPTSGNTTDMFTFNVTYKGETLDTLNLVAVAGTVVQGIALSETDETDTVYLDGKSYSAVTSFASANNYTATVYCNDTYGRAASNLQKFKVT